MFKSALKATVAYTVFMVGLSAPALAADAPAVAPLPIGNVPPSASAPHAAVTTTTTTTTTAPTPSPSMPPMQPMTATAGSPVPPADGSLPPVVNGNASSNLTAPLATPKIVQEAVTGLQKTDPINMDDMIRAQDAINRLDLLLEIEKRQTELKKLRDDRNKPANMGNMASGIPASALQLPPMKVSPSPTNMALPKPAETKPSGDSYALKRIVGAEGRYAAVISVGDNKVLNVKSGETLPDGSKVKSVSLTSVTLIKDKKSKTLTIPSDSYIVRGADEFTP